MEGQRNLHPDVHAHERMGGKKIFGMEGEKNMLMDRHSDGQIEMQGVKTFLMGKKRKTGGKRKTQTC